MFILGITGSIGSGKSTVAKFLRQLKWPVIDADQAGHRCYEVGSEGYEAVIKAFGTGIVAPDGTINRKALGSIVFADKAKMTQLNNIAWPLIRKIVENQIRDYEARGHTHVAVEAAVMLQAGWETACTEVWGVVAPTEQVIERLAQRNGLSREAALQRIAAGVSEDVLRAKCHVIVDNTGDLLALATRVKSLIRERVQGGIPSELVLHVDENDNVLGNVPRHTVRAQKLWHRATYIVLRNSRDELYVQQRTLIKDVYPGYLDAVTGGVVGADEDYDVGAYRELEEEMGVKGVPLKFLFKFRVPEAQIWGGAYECVYDGPVTPQFEEVEAVHMIPLNDVFKRYEAGEKFTDDGIQCLRLYKQWRTRHESRTWWTRALIAAASVAAAGLAYLQ